MALKCLQKENNVTADKASQKRQRLLFYGFIRLWLRNSGFALGQPRHDGEFYLIKLRNRFLYFAYALSAVALFFAITFSKRKNLTAQKL
jgi:hypothetical protein